jgi:hypothetical protein
VPRLLVTLLFGSLTGFLAGCASDDPPSMAETEVTESPLALRISTRHAELEEGEQSLYFRDPSGNSVELVTPGRWGLPSGGEFGK